MKAGDRFRLMVVGGLDVDRRIDLMRYLAKDFNVLATGSELVLRAQFASMGFPYRYYPLTRRINPLADISTLIRLLLIFREESPDVVHAFDTKPSVLARLAARFAGVPVVIGTLPGLGSLYVGDGAIPRAVRVIYEGLQRLASHSSDLTIFQNHEDAQQFITRGIVPESRATVLPGSGVRTDLFNPAKISQSERAQVRAELDLPSDAVLITMVSRLIRSKGIMEFAVAAQTVHKRHPQVTFLLVGPLDEESVDRLTPEELSELARIVTWAGVRKDIPAVLATSDIFVLPSFYREGIPRVLLEAASMGLPLITTDLPGCWEVVEHGMNGFLVPPRNPDALAQAMLRLVEEPETRHRLGQASRQRAVDRFDLSIIADQTLSIYRELLARKGSSPGANK